MNIDRPTTKEQSLGKLRIVSKMDKEELPTILTLRLQRHTAAAMLEQFDSETSDVLCNIAGWVNQDHEGPYLTVEIDQIWNANLKFKQPRIYIRTSTGHAN